MIKQAAGVLLAGAVTPRMTTPLRTFPAAPWRNRLVLLALWLLFYCSFTLFTPPLLDDADSVHAEVAREMLLRHDYRHAVRERHPLS